MTYIAICVLSWSGVQTILMLQFRKRNGLSTFSIQVLQKTLLLKIARHAQAARMAVKICV